MKKIYLYIAAFLLTLALAAGFAACNETGNEPGGAGFSLAEGANMVWLDRYEEAEVALASGDAAALDWTSANESIVTVEEGLLIAQGEGGNDGHGNGRQDVGADHGKGARFGDQTSVFVPRGGRVFERFYGVPEHDHLQR